MGASVFGRMRTLHMERGGKEVEGHGGMILALMTL